MDMPFSVSMTGDFSREVTGFKGALARARTAK